MIQAVVQKIGIRTGAKMIVIVGIVFVVFLLTGIGYFVNGNKGAEEVAGYVGTVAGCAFYLFLFAVFIASIGAIIAFWPHR